MHTYIHIYIYIYIYTHHFIFLNDIGPLQSQMWTPPMSDEHETKHNNME